MKKVLITGNKNKDLTSVLVPILESKGFSCTCVSRDNGYNFEDGDSVIKKVVKLSDEHDVFINMYANYFYKASVLAHKIYKNWLDKGQSHKRMINIGSTTDRVRKGKLNLYHYEKLALRELSAGLSLVGVWEKGPKVTHVSFGTLENRASNHVNRKCMDMNSAAKYILWILEQPENININEISVDPIQV